MIICWAHRRRSKNAAFFLVTISDLAIYLALNISMFIMFVDQSLKQSRPPYLFGSNHHKLAA